MLAEITGLDVEAHHDEAVQTVGASFATSTFEETRVLLEQARALVNSDQLNTDEIAQACGRAEGSLGAIASSGVDELSRLAFGAGNVGELTESLRILELSVVLRESVTAMTKAYFGARFAIGRPTDSQAELLFREAARYDATLDELKLVVPPTARSRRSGSP